MKLFKPVKKGILSLTVGGIAIGMTEFMMMGVLPDVANSLQISIPDAGHLISIYALGVVVGAPTMTMIAGRYPPKNILIVLMGMFMLFNALFALSPNYGLLLTTRFFAGLPHGAFFGIGAVVASRIAEPGRQARAVSAMFAGLTIANIVGVPIGTYIGHSMNWRYSFAIVAGIALLAALSIVAWMPKLPKQENHSVKNELKVFANKQVWMVLAICAIGTGGLFAWISYIAPLMTDVAGIDPSNVTRIMMIAGLGMAVGNLIGGKLADTYSPLKATAGGFFSMMISLILVGTLSSLTPVAIGLTFVTGAIAFAAAAPLQTLMIRTAKGSEMIASSSLQASFNIGNALGAFLGGLPIAAGHGYTSAEWVGAGLAFSGFGLCLLLASQRNLLSKKKISSGVRRLSGRLSGAS